MAVPAEPRLEWVDRARGLGILLVVYGHVMRGLVLARLVPADGWFRTGDALLYAFHMPLFFLLAGLFAARARARGRRPFLAGLLRALAWPYALWSLVQGGLAWAAPGGANHAVRLADLLAIPVAPLGQFWFLYVLFLGNLVLLAPRGWWWPLAAAALLVAARCGAGPMPCRLGLFLPAFLLGVRWTAEGATRGLARPAVAALVAGLAWPALAALWWAGWLDPAADWPRALLAGLAAGLAGALGLLALVRHPLAGGRGLALLGRASMPIFLLHVVVVGAVRTALVRFGPPLAEPAWILLLLAAGLGGPLALARAAARAGWDRALGFGGHRHGPAPLAAMPLELAPAKADVGLQPTRNRSFP